MAITIGVVDRIVVAIHKHIASDKPLPGACEAVGIDEAADVGVVVAALQIIESRLLGMGVAKSTK